MTTVFEPPHRAAMRGTTPNAPFVVTLSFSTVPGGTRVDVVSDIALTGAARLFWPLVTAFYGRMWSGGLSKLKQLMDRGALVGPSRNDP